MGRRLACWGCLGVVSTSLEGVGAMRRRFTGLPILSFRGIGNRNREGWGCRWGSLCFCTSPE